MSSATASTKKIAAVLGIGPALGSSIARRFSREGFAVALMARNVDKLKALEQEIRGMGGTALAVPADATNPKSVEQAFARVRDELGDSPHVLVYNAGAYVRKGILETSPEEFEYCFKSNCMGAFLAAKAVLPDMIKRGSGTILLSGATASLRGSAGFSNLAVGKFGLRALGQSLAREFGPKGIHVAHIIIDGQIDTPQIREAFPDRPKHTLLNPDAIAEQYWNLHAQDPTTWTFELDLRPNVEKW